MSLYDQFSEDNQGRKFLGVMNDRRIDFRSVVELFENPEWARRMIESEAYHDRPALAGVIRELEAQPDVSAFFESYDGHTTKRFRQAIGVVTRIVMENHGWKTTGRKGSLGTRGRVAPGTTTPGAYRNTGGISTWFTRAERYERA